MLSAYLPGVDMQVVETYDVSHTRTVVRECFKGDEASHGKGQNSTPHHTKIP